MGNFVITRPPSSTPYSLWHAGGQKVSGRDRTCRWASSDRRIVPKRHVLSCWRPRSPELGCYRHPAPELRDKRSFFLGPVGPSGATWRGRNRRTASSRSSRPRLYCSCLFIDLWQEDVVSGGRHDHNWVQEAHFTSTLDKDWALLYQFPATFNLIAWALPDTSGRSAARARTLDDWSFLIGSFSVI